MTAEQIKAKELVERFYNWSFDPKFVKLNNSDVKQVAKNMAVLCVEEIVDELNNRSKRCCPMDGALLIKQVNHYLKVKEEINKL